MVQRDRMRPNVAREYRMMTTGDSVFTRAVYVRLRLRVYDLLRVLAAIVSTYKFPSRLQTLINCSHDNVAIRLRGPTTVTN